MTRHHLHGPPRLAWPEEAAALAALVEAAYLPWVAIIGCRPGPMADDYAGRIAAGQAWVVGADAPVAMLVLEDEGDSLLLDNVAVAPSAQGVGLGRYLVGFAEAEARRRGKRQVRLYTHALMAANIALYERLGFVETERRSDKGFDRVFMAKSLPPQ